MAGGESNELELEKGQMSARYRGGGKIENGE